MRSIFSICLVLLIATAAKSQDVHLTQYYTSGLSLNPANTGNFNGDLRFTVNYRSQWKQVTAPIRTSMFSFEKKLPGITNEFGIGILLINDQLSTFNLQTNKALLSGSFQKEISKNRFRIGVQGGMVFRNTDLSEQTFPAQWNYSDGTFDQSIPNRESTLQNNYNYADFTSGISWTRVFGNKKVQAGYGLFHLTRPRDGFTRDHKSLPFRHAFNSTATIPLSDVYTLLPHILYMNTASATDFIIGSNAGRKLNKETGVLLGAGFRGSTINGDAVLAVIGFNYKQLEFGFSMDFTVSELNTIRNKSAFEFSIAYTTPARYLNKVTIPCDRY